MGLGKLEETMDTDAFAWEHCSEADDNEMSAYIDMWKCADSPL